MALMGSDQAKMGQNDQALAVLEWLRSEGAQNLLRQVSADRAQRADEPDIQRGQEEVQRRRDTAVHDWLNTPEAQRFLMGREDADIAMRQQGQRGPGSGMGQVPANPRQQMLEGLMAAGRGTPDFDRGGGGSQFVGRWPQSGSFAQSPDPGGAAWQSYQDPRNDYAGPGSTFQSPPSGPDFVGRGGPDFSMMGPAPRPRPEFQGANWGRQAGPGYGPPR